MTDNQRPRPPDMTIFTIWQDNRSILAPPSICEWRTPPATVEFKRHPDMLMNQYIRRLIRKSTAALVAGVLFAPGYATMSLRVESTVGDPVGWGMLYELSDADALFKTSCENGHARFRVEGNDVWTLEVASPTGTPLATDLYENATRYPAELQMRPGLKVSRNGYNCSRVYGHFVVRELACSASNVVEKVAIDVEQYCDSANAGVLRAYLRIDSAIPAIVPQPLASAGVDLAVTEGDTVQLDGSKSRASAGIASVQWQQVGGPPVSLAGGSTLRPTFTAPDVAPGGGTVVLSVLITDQNGLSDSNQMRVEVRDSEDPRTALTVLSDPGDLVARGQTSRITQLDGQFTTFCASNSNSIAVGVTGDVSWGLGFAAPANSALIPEVYDGATRSGFNSPMLPGFNISRDSGGCNRLYGRFIVREIACSAGNTVTKLAVDAEQHCEQPDSPSLRAFLRINSAIPDFVPQPTATAGLDQAVTEGDLVQLDGSKSLTPAAIASVSWQLVSGPPVVLLGGSTLRPSFVAPEVPAGGAVVVLELQITGQNGLSDANRVNIFVRDAGDSQSVLMLVSHPGDYVGAGISRSSTIVNSVISSTTCTNSRATVAFRGDESWTAIFAANTGGVLQPGTYEDAVRTATPSSPGLDVYGDGRGCNVVAGRFVVHEKTCNANGTVRSLAADIEQHCDQPAAPVMRGYLRVASAVPIPDLVDRGCRLDVDGDGLLSGVRDGSGLLRGVAGLLGTALAGSLSPSPGATRWAATHLSPYFRNTCAILPKTVGPPGCSLDLDGDGKIQLTTDGVIATRLIAGLSGDTVLANATGVGATRTSWSQLAPYLAACKLLPAP